ncbi:alpha/beta hydrolase [Mesorhizobium sp. M0768]|uniref:alpha/beta fold hydrolase n=1 Tax=Mesorhizobium sp. M0768 TaxID=2956996 RepID=UPI003334E7B0
MTKQFFHCLMISALAAFASLVLNAAAAESMQLGVPPAGFSSADVTVNGSSLHYVRGGQGPAVILVHGFPENWVEYQGIMPKLAQRFTVVAVDLPGIGRSAPPSAGYDAVNLATQIHGLAEALHLVRPYVVGHDIGAHVTYAYVRLFSASLRGAMILDTPIAGLAGSKEAGAGLWHVGFIQTPGLAEKLVPGRQDAFLGWFFDLGNFTAEERAYYVKVYDVPQLHAAFEIYRAIPQNVKWNASQAAPNAVPLIVTVGEKSLFSALLPTFIEGYRAVGMIHVEGAVIPDAGHYVLNDNPEAVARLIERFAARDAQ